MGFQQKQLLVNHIWQDVQTEN